MKINHWTIIKFSHYSECYAAYFLCKCDCGYIGIVSGTSLVNERSKSCGCINDIENKLKLIDKFGKLTVIKFHHQNETGRKHFLCKCDCGNETIVAGSHLLNKSTRSCGCLVKETNRIETGLAAFNQILSNYKYHAEQRNLDFLISEEEFKKLIFGNCYYCGIEPFSEQKNICNNGNIIYNGIDRIDNSKGYIQGNVVTCCKTCNLSKKDMTQEDFLNWIKRVYNHSIKE